MPLKTLFIALVALIGIGLVGMPNVSAAPASGAAIGAAATAIGGVQPVWWDRFGRWHPNRRAYVGPPVFAPACRSVRVCGRWGRCWWTRRCY